MGCKHTVDGIFHESPSEDSHTYELFLQSNQNNGLQVRGFKNLGEEKNQVVAIVHLHTSTLWDHSATFSSRAPLILTPVISFLDGSRCSTLCDCSWTTEYSSISLLEIRVAALLILCLLRRMFFMSLDTVYVLKQLRCCTKINCLSY